MEPGLRVIAHLVLGIFITNTRKVIFTAEGISVSSRGKVQNWA
jgi:hypothetical protein